MKEPKEPFEYDIDESWEACALLIGSIAKIDPDELEGLDVLRDLWEESKKPLLELLGPSGRIVLGMEDSPVSSADVSTALNKATEYIFERACAGKITPPVRVCACTVLEEVCQQVLSTKHAGAMLAENKLVEPLPDPRPGREGQMLGAGTKFGRYVRLFVMSRDDIEAELRDLVADTVCEALSRTTSFLAGSKQQQVVLSVNPLDLLMSSMHTTGWGSCHTLGTGGYTTGPLAYTLDNCTAVAYVTNRFELCETVREVLPVKTWRQMVFFDLEHGSALLSREYPGMVAGYARAARKAAATVLSRYYDLDPPRWYVVHNPKCCGGYPDDDDDPETYSVIYYPNASWHYADGIESRVRLKPNGQEPEVYPGVDAGDLFCASCGQPRYDTCRKSLVCSDCSGDRCCSCGRSLGTYDIYRDDEGLTYCSDCYWEAYAECGYCGDVVPVESVHMVTDGLGDYIYACADCLSERTVRCVHCDYNVDLDYSTTIAGGRSVCNDCAEEHFQECVQCGELYYRRNLLKGVSGHLYCVYCAEDVFVECCCCGDQDADDEMVEDVHGGLYCEDCADQYLTRCSDCWECFPNSEWNSEGTTCAACTAAREEGVGLVG